MASGSNWRAAPLPLQPFKRAYARSSAAARAGRPACSFSHCCSPRLMPFWVGASAPSLS